MIKEPTEGWEPDGDLHDCDICGVTYRWRELDTDEEGNWVCPYCTDSDEEWQLE